MSRADDTKNAGAEVFAERLNRTLMEMTRSMLSNMHWKFWDEAINTAAYLRNRRITRSLPAMTPYEPLTDETPRVFHLREFFYVNATLMYLRMR